MTCILPAQGHTLTYSGNKQGPGNTLPGPSLLRFKTPLRRFGVWVVYFFPIHRLWPL